MVEQLGMVLVIEDDESIRGLLVMALENEGYVVTAPEKIEDVETQASLATPKEDFQVIVHDLTLWGGQERPDLIRGFRIKYPESLLILLTAVADGKSSLGIDCDRRVGKPFDLYQLVDSINNYVLQRGHQRITDPRI